MDLKTFIVTATALATQFGLKLLGAIAFWVVGQWLINFAVRLVRSRLKSKVIEPSLLQYLTSALSVTLTIILIVAILGFFGISTTSFAALLAGAGVAIGAAWGGLLANFAAGVFLMIFRPFKIGDFVTAGEVTGTVQEIGLFATTINTPENVLTIVGNHKISAGNIQNFSANPYRRVDLVAHLDHSISYNSAIRLLKEKLCQIPNVLTNPTPDVEILELSPTGPVLAVRPYCSNEHYWQVYFDTNRMILEMFGEVGDPAP
ncbi:MAG: mechanosensitive ion channel family protein [Chroococcidiopsidaceae cyanobacterium CP_BM_ER_R8_30]|nr:mechanosensitive ion channel family protein [Chroococcidiopsidaceae cyanobacterium CP_BM_ER_R8_30]